MSRMAWVFQNMVKREILLDTFEITHGLIMPFIYMQPFTSKQDELYGKPREQI